ncbi:IST1 homolog isoform X1 [Prionailurus iriomotensis]
MQNRLSKVICKLPAVPPGEIMFISAFKADRLQVNLQLVVNCLKLLEKKKTEQAQRARKEIAGYLANGKDERARIQVEHVI